MPTILLINPNTSSRSTDMMVSVARPLLPVGVTIIGISATRGVSMILDEETLAEAADEVVRIGTERAEGCDAVIVAAFGNPGARRLREILPIPVVGIGEAAILQAAGEGRRFGVATTTPDLVRSIEAGVSRFGLTGSFTGVRVPEGDPVAFAANPAAQDVALAEAATACIEQDGAEAVVIGGGPLSDTAARLRTRFRNPIVEPVPAAIQALMRQLAKPKVLAAL